MQFSKTRKLEIRKKYYNILSKYKGYYFITDDKFLYLSQEEMDWENGIVQYKSNIEKVINMEYLKGIPSYLSGTVEELISQLVIVKIPKKVI